jgi:hypothetical protein
VEGRALARTWRGQEKRDTELVLSVAARIRKHPACPLANLNSYLRQGRQVTLFHLKTTEAGANAMLAAINNWNASKRRYDAGCRNCVDGVLSVLNAGGITPMSSTGVSMPSKLAEALSKITPGSPSTPPSRRVRL